METTNVNSKGDYFTTEQWEIFLGEQFRQIRIRAGKEQTELAAAANISVGALQNLEGGKGSSMKTMVKVVRALDRIDWLLAFAPKISVSPLQMLKTNSAERVRQKAPYKRKSTKAKEQ